MTNPFLVEFAAGPVGPWQIDRIEPIVGEGLPSAARLAALEGGDAPRSSAAWVLRGTLSNTRYTTRSEVTALVDRQEGLGRPAATLAALIPIRKNAAWWALAQDERRAIFETASHHTAVGLEYLPAISRRLHHARELGEPFDFITWFEYAPEHAEAFEQLLRRLRATAEWGYVDREIDIRLSRIDR